MRIVIVALVSALALAPLTSLAADDAPAAADKGKARAARFKDRAYIELRESAGLLDLNKDFTIELWCKWFQHTPYSSFASDEIWPDMSPEEVSVADARGWVLRRWAKDGKTTIQFTVSNGDPDWLHLTGTIPHKSEGLSSWTHLAVCRQDDSLRLYVNGKRSAARSVKGMELLPSPTALYLGTRKNGAPDSRFDGFIRSFRVSQSARYKAAFKPGKDWVTDDQTLILMDFVDAEGEFVADQSGDRHDGDLQGVELADTLAP